MNRQSGMQICIRSISNTYCLTENMLFPHLSSCLHIFMRQNSSLKGICARQRRAAEIPARRAVSQREVLTTLRV